MIKNHYRGGAQDMLFKKISATIGFSILVFLAASFVAHALTYGDTSCRTCGVTIMSTLFFIGMASLLSAIWLKGGATKKQRLAAFGVSVVISSFAYFAFEIIGLWAFAYGGIGVGLGVGFLSNIICVVLAVVISTRMVKRANKNLIEQI